MRVIDELISADLEAETGTAKVEIRKESPFVREDGTVDEVVYVEMLAQAAAAYEGYRSDRQGEERLKGLLLGTRRFAVHGVARVGDVLVMSATKEAEFSGFGVVNGKIFRGEEPIASGQLKFWHD